MSYTDPLQAALDFCRKSRYYFKMVLSMKWTKSFITSCNHFNKYFQIDQNKGSDKWTPCHFHQCSYLTVHLPIFPKLHWLNWKISCLRQDKGLLVQQLQMKLIKSPHSMETFVLTYELQLFIFGQSLSQKRGWWMINILGRIWKQEIEHINGTWRLYGDYTFKMIVAPIASHLWPWKTTQMN